MAYTTFSTESAHYYLNLHQHLYNRKPIQLPKNLDAIVAEHAYGNFKEEINAQNPSEFNIPVYACDPHVNILGFLRGAFCVFADIPVVPICGVYAMTDLKINDLFGRIVSDYMWLMQDPLIELRNAMNARLIEEVIAPRVSGLSGKRKPLIGILFGAAHIGLKYDILSKKRRDLTLKNWEKFNFTRPSGFKKKSFGRVIEALPNGNEWMVSDLATK